MTVAVYPMGSMPVQLSLSLRSLVRMIEVYRMGKFTKTSGLVRVSGRLKIAQRFIAGNAGNPRLSP